MCSGDHFDGSVQSTATFHENLSCTASNYIKKNNIVSVEMILYRIFFKKKVLTITNLKVFFALFLELFKMDF